MYEGQLVELSGWDVIGDDDVWGFKSPSYNYDKYIYGDNNEEDDESMD